MQVNRNRDEWRVAERTAREAESAAPRRTEPPSHEARMEQALARLPSVPLDLSALVRIEATAPVDPQAARDAEVQGRMNACRDAASGPYTVNGESVYAAPMFRMTTHVVTDATKLDVIAIGTKAGLAKGDIGALFVGQGRKEVLVKLTQALIDAGRLPATPSDLAARIKTLQWQCGIGLDCAGYAKEALRAARGKEIPFRAPGCESFEDVGARSSFAHVSLAKARPGDLITLRPMPGERWGHNVVVYDNHLVDDERRKQLEGSGGPAVAAFLASPGPHRAIQVDSSWGAGVSGNTVGGYRRDTWLYDESSHRWASWRPGVTPLQLVVSDHGPSGDVFHGVYRPR